VDRVENQHLGQPDAARRGVGSDAVLMARRVRRLMLVSVYATAALVSGGLALIAFVSRDSDIDVDAINAATNQRLLCERALTDIATISTAREPSSIQAARVQLRTTLQRLREQRASTQHDQQGQGAHSQISQLWRSSLAQSQQPFNEFDHIASGLAEPDSEVTPQQLKTLTTAGRHLAAHLSEVSDLAAEDSAAIGSFNRAIALLVGVLVICVLIIKWITIYRPAVNHLDTRTRELAVREHEATKLAEIARRTSNVVVMCNSEGYIEWVNEAFHRVTGYTPDEAIGRKPGSFLQGPDTDMSEVARIRAAVQRGERVTAELLNYSKAGKPYWIRIDIEPRIDDRGELCGFMAIETDVTQERASRDAVRAAEAFLRRSLDAMDAHIAILDSTGTIVAVNEAWRQFAIHNGGGSASCLEGANYFKVCEAIDANHTACSEAAQVARAIRSALGSDDPIPPIQYACHSPSENRWFKIAVRGFESNGKRFAIVAHQNHTSVVLAEQRMIAEKVRLSAFVEHAPAAIAMFDRQMRYIAVSHRWLKDYGLEGQEIIGKCHYDVFPALPERWKAIHARCLNGSIEKCDDDTWRPDGWTHDQHLQWELRPWTNPNNEIEGVLMFTKDITAECMREAELARLREVAEQANHAKSAFLANMSHEIRTPLTAILGYADLLAELGDLTKAPEERITTIATIRRAGEHLLNVVNDVLDLSKIEAGQMLVERIDTPVREIMQEIESVNKVRAAAKHVALNFELDASVPSCVRTDPTRFRQLAMNLVGNAIKFTDIGSVTVRLTAADHGEETQLTLVVEDTGPGMTAEQIQRLFLPFSQADETVTRKHGGTGLGLVISRKIARMLAGDVQLTRSEVGKGSTFTATLIAGRATVAKPAPAPAAIAPHSTGPGVKGAAFQLRGRILLAEDGLDNQKLIAFHIRKAGATIDVADNGKIALDMLDKAAAAGTPYDLLITDMQMPEMDGYTLATTLRSRGCPIPVIALTAHAMPEDRARCINAGCDDYATKPIDKATLLGLCAAWMQHGADALVRGRSAA
jgi:PAS domain S-box-containing protein